MQFSCLQSPTVLRDLDLEQVRHAPVVLTVVLCFTAAVPRTVTIVVHQARRSPWAIKKLSFLGCRTMLWDKKC